MKNEKVVILGASDKSDRYSYKAMKMLEENGHEVILVHPTLESVEGKKVLHSLSDVKDSVDTLTMYVNPKISSTMKNEIVALRPKRVILNPGTENSELESVLKKAGISCEHACTLVLLTTDQF
ncbi:CoA-binding domain protein [Bacteriovorax sp. BSW11_IV]|uniref:CoA-binding protein n=1 Tax=Bacteriovorax sp. BSW11_IV TaxID=1353529 RepID=UPI00038A33E0|nr:CoA-binding protein [Bacteriovorax sp. BSW11_IV]EQC49931.1 CoA-binding domain protein [Bacteriovorax sp. BSW11_IV]